MKINALRIEISSTNGDYGFSCIFKDGLNIIRGDNSSGKSTLLNSIVYAVGMEEILGCKGEKCLPYSLKEYLPIDGERIPVINSRVIVEIKNNKGDFLTLFRPIKSDEKNSKLIELIEGDYLTGNVTNVAPKPTYVHDPGSAEDKTVGYFRVLEKFIGSELPYVPSTSGGEVKLYIQTIFSAFIVEQKRGWTDYIANTPYFRVRNVKNKIIEYLLSLDVFGNDRRRNSLNTEITEINQLWAAERFKIKLIEDENKVLLSGIPRKPTVDFSQDLISTNKVLGDEEQLLSDYIEGLIVKVQSFKDRKSNAYQGAPPSVVLRMELAVEELSRLSSLHETMVSEIQINKSLIVDYSKTKELVVDDLKKNKLAKKIKVLGGDYNISIASDLCPTCNQTVDDSLLLADMHAQPMNIDENIMYLDKQEKMLKRYINGVEQLIHKQSRQLDQIQSEISNKKNEVLGIKHDISSVSEISEADLRSQLRNEDEIIKLDSLEDELYEILSELSLLSSRFKETKVIRASLPTDYLSSSDRMKLRYMERVFKGLAKNFGYKSADTNEIILNYDTYLPFLSGLALREINNNTEITDADIKADSSASDFVRLIWAYLISIYDTSTEFNGNHPGLIAFDEPGQHSMADSSVNAVFKAVNSYTGLQCIVAASFDENDDLFNKETDGVQYHLIEVGDKLIKRI